MDWDHDVCLSCDNQTRDGEKFCSPACQLADLERGGAYSEPPTPASLPNNTPSWDSWQTPTTTSTSSSRPHYFQLAPPVNFSAYRSHPQFESPPTSPRARSSRPQSTSYFTQQHASSATTAPSPPTGRGLILSPSRSSLSSVSSSGSNASTPGLSQEQLNQLRDYSGAFDTTRDWKRRVTYG